MLHYIKSFCQPLGQICMYRLGRPFATYSKYNPLLFLPKSIISFYVDLKKVCAIMKIVLKKKNGWQRQCNFIISSFFYFFINVILYWVKLWRHLFCCRWGYISLNPYLKCLSIPRKTLSWWTMSRPTARQCRPAPPHHPPVTSFLP